MLRNTRSICLDVCDYENHVICNLYDNTADVSGQATDVFVNTERNGWKELSFSLPATCITDEGEEENFRLQYLIADYRIRLQTEKETDWYLISEPKVNHNYKAKTVDVVAGHICQLLKTKNLDLEFSDDEGNNVGTAEELLRTILDGTGWTIGNVAEFLEDDGVTVKVRSLVAGSKTGAFMLISNLCEKFEAKPIYHGDGRIVDIVPMNPFSEVEGAEIPEEVLKGEKVLELNYGNNVKDISRTLNTENLVTRLYAYGAYGDKTNGMCSLQTVEHTEYTFIMSSYSNGTEFKFIDKDHYPHYFKVNTNIASNDKLIWSDMDQASRSYMWNDTQKVIYKVYSNPQEPTWTTIIGTISRVANRFDYVMNFNYYDKIGLLSDEMALEIAKFQRNMPSIIDTSTNASRAFLDAETELSRVAESNTGFLRLHVKNYSTGSDGELVLNLNKSVYPDGIMYRTDYDEARRNYFSWYCAEALKDNGDPVTGIGSVVYIIHNTNPITWQKAYIKEIDGSTDPMDYSVRNAPDPSTITLWISRSKVTTLSSDDRFYLFSTNSISGRMGVRESEIESLQQTLQQATKVVTEEHPTYFVWDNDPAPSLDVVGGTYGWYYRAYSNDNIGDLYFCYGVSGEVAWKRALISETTPSVINGGYFFNLKTKILYHGEGQNWVDISESPILVPTMLHPSGEYYTAPTTEAKRLSQAFSKVSYYCLRHDMLHKGLYDKYTYKVTTNNGLNPGNYAFKSEYGFYWVFSTDLKINKNNNLWLDTVKYLVFQNEDIADVVKPEAKPYESIDFPVANEFDGISILQGNIIATTGAEENSNTLKRSNHITIYPNVTYRYSLPANSFVVFYDQNRRYITYQNLSTSGTFTTTPKSKYIRFVFKTDPTSSQYVRVDDYMNKLFLKDTQYTILSPLTSSGEKSGILKLIKDFADTADSCYMNYLAAFKAAQKVIKDNDDALKSVLGDMYREGYWQKNEYVEGDEEKLYKDALKNLEKIAKPEATYDIQFIDLYTANKGMGYAIDEDLADVEWPDIEITDAIHLIDETIDVNCWAFIDKIEKCYDQPWKTQLTINTDLSLIAQHSFTDVLARIAEVANETSANQTIYKRAAAISGTGKFTAEKLEGTIKANNALLMGGSSNWYTDSKGNIIFESSDGQSAMMLTGYGWAVANSRNSYGDWDFRYTTTGNGMTADFIAAGEISAKLLTAGSITTDKLNASVGQELEIGSNRALMLYATVDGYRPSGSLKTLKDNGDGTYSPIGSGDSYIQIAAQKGAEKAYIDIASGGLVNIYSGSEMNLESGATMNLKTGGTGKVAGVMNLESTGVLNMKSGSETNIQSGGTINIKAGGTESVSGEVNIESTGKINIKSGGDMFVNSGGKMTLQSGSNMYVNSGGNMYIQSGGKIDIQSGSTFTVSSTNFVIDASGNVMLKGTVYAWAGNIAGFTIAGDKNSAGTGWTRQYMYAGNTTSVDSTGKGIYLGTDGINFGGGIFKVSSDGTKSHLKIKASDLVFESSSYEDDYKASIIETVRVYKLGSSSSTAPDLTQNNYSNDTTWKEDVLTVNSTNKYLWSRNRYKTRDSKYTYGTAVYESELSIKLNETHKEYMRTNTTTKPSSTDSGWAASVPAPQKDSAGIELNPYVWVCDFIKLTNGNTDRINIHRDTGLESMSAASIKAINIATGIDAVPYVDSTGIKIQGSTLQVKSTGEVQILGNGKVYIGTASSNSAVCMDKDGIAIGSSGSISVASLGTVTIGNAGSLFTIGSDKTNAYIYNGKSTLDSDTTDGIYLGTNGIALGKGKFKVTNAGYLTSTSGKIGGWIIDTNLLYADNKAVGFNSAAVPSDQTATIRIWAGSTTSGSAPFYVRSDGYMQSTSGQIGGWTIGANSLKSNNSKVGMYSNDNTATEIAFWAGDSTPSSANFYVTNGGTLKATSAELNSSTIKGNSTVYGNIYASGGSIGASINGTTATGGWSITSNTLNANNYQTGLSAASGDTTIAIWAGASAQDKISAAPFRVLNNGTVYATKAYLSGNSEIKGKLYASSGLIGCEIGSDGMATGGWNISKNVLSSGATTNYVGLSSDPNSTYAIWAGAKSSSDAKFKVNRNGTIEATGASISGTISAGAGSTIGGWYIGSDRIRSGSASSVGSTGMGSSTGTNDATFWAGYSGSGSLSGSSFYVTAGGALTANNATIKGLIKATSLYIGATSSSDGTKLKMDDTGFIVTNSTTVNADKVKTIAGIKVDGNGVVIGIDTKDAAGALRKSANIKINDDTGIVISSTDTSADANASKVAKLSLNNGKIAIACTDVGQSGSGIYITSSSIDIKSSAKFTIDSTNFQVKSDGSVKVKGELEATTGKIGGWTVDTDWFYKGSGSNCVCLVGTTSNTTGNVKAYAMYAGGSWPEDVYDDQGTLLSAGAPFRVKRNGDVYLNALMVWDDEKEEYKKVDFSKNFSNAISYSSGSWNGNTFTATLKIFGKNTNKSISLNASVVPRLVRVTEKGGQTWNDSRGTVWCWMQISGQTSSESTLDVEIDASKAYTAGKTDADSAYTHLGTRELGYMDHGSFESVGSHNWYYK